MSASLALIVMVKFCGVGHARSGRWAWWKIFLVVSLVLMLMPVLVHSPVIWYSFVGFR